MSIANLSPARSRPDAFAKTLTPAFWLAMFGASAFGTNLGDYWADDLGLDRFASFASLAIICAVAIAIDRAYGRRTEAGYWVAIVALRAAATNAADYLTHDLGLGYPMVVAILGIVTLAAAAITTADAMRRDAPLTNAAYWLAMLLAGLFGTAGGDFASHLIGLAPAAIGLGLVLALLLAARRRVWPSVLLGYWIVVMTERSAATPFGDWLASRHGAGLGLPLAMACTGALFAIGLGLRARYDRT